MEEVLSFDLPKVTITGGEPLLQIEEVEKLTRILLAEDLRVTIETNGTIPWVLDAGSKGDNLRIVTDYKLPSSGMEKRMCEQTFEDLFEFDVIKFVVADDADYQRMKEVLIECLWEAQIAVSPLYAGAITHSGEPAITPHQLAEKILDDPDLKDVRFNVQLHKIIGVK
jgi:7-carboxy-7-deazaguanine synthase